MSLTLLSLVCYNLWSDFQRESAEKKIEETTGQFRKGYGMAGGGDYVNWDEQDLNKEFRKMKDMGASGLRFDISQEEVQPDTPEEYRWEDVDKVVETAKNNGLKIVAVITYSPKWAHPNQECQPWEHCLPDDPETFGKFSKEVAKRYKGDIQVYEIWNEPNIPIFSAPKSDPERYAECLKTAYKNIKEIDKSAIILTGGLARAGDDNDSYSSTTFIEKLYGLGTQNYFDGIAIHPYNYPEGEDWSEPKKVRNVMLKNGDGRKRIWITEYGAPAIEIEGEGLVSEERQKEMIDRIFELRDRNEWIAGVFIYSFRDNANWTEGYISRENFFGITTLGGREKPACEILRARFCTTA